MTDADALLSEYEAAMTAHCDICAAHPEQYHTPDSATFCSLRSRLMPFAESGDIRCQYAVATILSLGLCHRTEEQQQQRRDQLDAMGGSSCRHDSKGRSDPAGGLAPAIHFQRHRCRRIPSRS